MIIQSGKKLPCELNLNYRFLPTPILPFMLSWCRILDLMQGFGQKRVRGLLPKTGNPKVLRCARRTLEHRFSRGPALPPAPCWEVTGGWGVTPPHWEVTGSWGVTPPRSGSGLLLLCATLPVINSPDFRMSLSPSHNCAPDSMK